MSSVMDFVWFSRSLPLAYWNSCANSVRWSCSVGGSLKSIIILCVSLCFYTFGEGDV